MGLALRFLLPLRARSRLRRGVAVLSYGAVLAAASPLSISAARAQAFSWGDAGSTTNTTGALRSRQQLGKSARGRAAGRRRPIGDFRCARIGGRHGDSRSHCA